MRYLLEISGVVLNNCDQSHVGALVGRRLHRTVLCLCFWTIWKLDLSSAMVQWRQKEEGVGGRLQDEPHVLYFSHRLNS